MSQREEEVNVEREDTREGESDSDVVLLAAGDGLDQEGGRSSRHGGNEEDCNCGSSLNLRAILGLIDGLVRENREGTVGAAKSTVAQSSNVSREVSLQIAGDALGTFVPGRVVAPTTAPTTPAKPASLSISETNAILLGLSLGSVFMEAMDLVGKRAILLVFFAADSVDPAAAREYLASVASVALLFPRDRVPDMGSQSGYKFRGVPAFVVAASDGSHVVDVGAGYCSCPASLRLEVGIVERRKAESSGEEDQETQVTDETNEDKKVLANDYPQNISNNRRKPVTNQSPPPTLCSHLLAAIITARNHLACARRYAPSLPLGSLPTDWTP